MPYVLYGVKHIDLVTLAPFASVTTDVDLGHAHVLYGVKHIYLHTLLHPCQATSRAWREQEEMAMRAALEQLDETRRLVEGGAHPH